MRKLQNKEHMKKKRFTLNMSSKMQCSLDVSVISGKQEIHSIISHWYKTFQNCNPPDFKGQGSRSPIISPVNSQKIQIACKTYLWSF